MMRECTFNTLWDGESTLISTDAKVNLETGCVSDIQVMDGLTEDGSQVETLDREYIDFVGVDGEFAVKDQGDGNYVVVDLPALIEALERAHKPSV